MKWAEFETLAGKLRTRGDWADTAAQVLDTFIAPVAPFRPRRPRDRCSPCRCEHAPAGTRRT